MLNKTEYNNVYICVLPKGVEEPSDKRMCSHLSSRKKTAPRKKKVAEEVVETDIESIDMSDMFHKDKIVEEVLECTNGTIALSGSEWDINELFTWFYKFGVHSETAKEKIILDESGMFHIFGDCNDGNYRYCRGALMHKEPAKCFGLVEVEPMEDGGFVWRDFSDFAEIKAVFEIEKVIVEENDNELAFY